MGYRYDELNRLQYVDDTSTGLPVRTTAYTYNANGSLETLTQPNDVVHTYGYDTLNRLRTLGVTRGATSLHTYEYKLRASGHRREVSDRDARYSLPATRSYQYDDLYRLTEELVTGDANGGNGTVGYTLDKVGNRSARTSTLAGIPARTSTYNARDWLDGDSYDANGNTVSGRLADLATQGNDVYDFENRLIVRTKANGTSVNVSYDADGNRILKNLLAADASPQATTSWLVDTNNPTGYAQVLEERTTTGPTTTLKIYTYGSALISQSLVSGPSSSVAHYYAFDGHGSVRELTDARGAVTDRYTYDAFGNLVHRTGATANAFLYCGEQYDADLGLYFLRARYLNADSGRFWSMDEFEGDNQDPISLHKYLYAHADPVMFSDPSGNFSLAELKATVTNIGLMARLAIPRIMTAATTITTAGIAMLRMGFERLLNVIQFASQRMAIALSQGRVLLRSASGGWRLRVLKLRSGGTGRPSYEILNWKNLARFEAHPINRNWPSWAFWLCSTICG